MKHTALRLDQVDATETGPALSSVRVPHLTAAAFCLTPGTRDAIGCTGEDRRLSRVKMDVRDGGVAQVLEAFENRRTPALLIVEIASTGATLLAEMDALAEICDPETRVVVIGAENDIALYRKLIDRGIAEYLVSTAGPLDYVATIQRLFAEGAAAKLGKVYAFVGAKGGVGASTLAQNVAWTIAEEQASPALLLDLDFRFGSAAVNLDLKLVTGLEKYIGDPDKLDASLLDRLSVPRGAFLSVLPGFEDPLGDVEPAPNAVERLIEIARASFPYVIVDLPHDWSPANRTALTSADAVIVVASPDLPNLRNTRALMERLRALRLNDAPPRVVLNACRMPRRKELDITKFARSIGVETCANIAFDAAIFGTASAAGRTLREQAPRSKAQKAVRQLALDLTGQGDRTRSGRFLGLFGRG